MCARKGTRAFCRAPTPSVGSPNVIHFYGHVCTIPTLGPQQLLVQAPRLSDLSPHSVPLHSLPLLA